MAKQKLRSGGAGKAGSYLDPRTGQHTSRVAGQPWGDPHVDEKDRIFAGNNPWSPRGLGQGGSGDPYYWKLASGAKEDVYVWKLAGGGGDVYVWKLASRTKEDVYVWKLQSTLPGSGTFCKLLDRGEAGDNVGLLLRMSGPAGSGAAAARHIPLWKKVLLYVWEGGWDPAWGPNDSYNNYAGVDR